MSQVYNESFAKAYNLLWKDWIEGIAPKLIDFIKQSKGIKIQSILDLCCGTGQLAGILADKGYQITGLDISPAMLKIAQENNNYHIQSGKVKFIEGDAADYALPNPVDCVISTYDSLNHLDNMDALKSCFTSTYNSINPGGLFIFDLNTRKGLESWQGVQVLPREDSFILTRGVVVEDLGKAFTRITAFIKMENNLYERIEQTAFNTIFKMTDVSTALLDSGWEKSYCAILPDLRTPVSNPEDHNRVFFIAQK